MATTPVANYNIIYQAVGKQWDVPVVGDLMAAFSQVPISHQNTATQTTLTFQLTGDDRAAIVDICYKHLSAITFEVIISEIIASHTV